MYLFKITKELRKISHQSVKDLVGGQRNGRKDSISHLGNQWRYVDKVKPLMTEI